MAEGADTNSKTSRALGDLFEAAHRGDSFDRKRSRQRVRSVLLGQEAEAPQIGPFYVLHPLGEGGMGVVYAAFDPRLGRKVAVKVLHASDESSPDEGLEGRILREARALAQLSHRNVVAVHEVGTDERGVYMAMEFVDGQTLGAWLREQPRGWSEILEVMRPAGEGLAAAHSAGLVHRDFKPDNVLLGRDGTVRVADFGVARSGTPAMPIGAGAAAEIGAEVLTRTGAVVGTPRYMAPEQHLGERVGASADQYSFCLTLLEGLTGAFPLPDTMIGLVDAKTGGEIAIPERDVTGRRVPPRLQAALIRGLAANADERFGSMDDLLASLAPSRRSRAWVLAAGGVAVGATLAVAIGVGAQQDPAVPSCPDFSGELADVWSPSTRDEIGAGLAEAGGAYSTKVWEVVAGDFDRFSIDYRDARAEVCRRQLEHEEPEASAQPRLECLALARANFEAALGELESPDELIAGRVAEVADVLRDPEVCLADRITYSRALRSVAPGQRAEEAAVRRELAAMAALAPVGKEEELRVKLDALASRHDLEALPGAAAAFHTLYGLSMRGPGRLEHAHTAVEYAVRAGDDAALGHALSELSNRCFDERKYGQMLRSSRLGLAVADRMERTATDESGRIAAARLRGIMLMQIGDAHRELGHDSEAIEALKASVAAHEASPEPDSRAIADALNNAAEVHRRHGRFDEAMDHYSRSLGLYEQVGAASHPNVGTILNNRGAVEFERGYYAVAKADLDRSLDMLLASEPHGGMTALTRFNLGLIATYESELDKAEHHLQLAYETWAKTPERTAAYEPVAIAALATIAHQRGDAETSLRMHRDSVTKLEAMLEAPHPVLAAVLAEEATTWMELGRHKDARKQLDRAVDMLDKTTGFDSGGGAAVLVIQAHSLLLMGELDLAEAAYARAETGLAGIGNPLHPRLAEVFAGRAALHRVRGEPDAAALCEANLAKIRRAHPSLRLWAVEGLRALPPPR